MPNARRIKLERLLVSLGLAIGLLLIVMAFRSAKTGGEAQNLPPGVNRVFPDKTDSVLRQTEVIAYLTPGYCGRFTINGIAIPAVESTQPIFSGTPGSTPLVSVPTGVGVDTFCFEPTPAGGVSAPGTAAVFDPGLSTLTFRPREGAVIDKFGPGPQRVQLEYWQIVDTNTVRRYNWVFTVDA